MWTLKITTQFKKDLKRYKNNVQKIDKLETVLSILKQTGTVPKEYNPHFLKGNYLGYMECHVEGDFLLIWIDLQQETICLTRLGTHSELFK